LHVVRKDLQDPRVLELPLECGVTCIAAHCAGKGGVVDQDYFGVWADLLRRYPNLYGDISAFNIPFRSRHFRACLESPLVERVVHGSDFPVPVFGHWAWLRGLISWADFRRWENCPNVLERDYQIKRALGYPEAVFSRVTSLLRFSYPT
jgi:hypothetical protein